MCVCVCVRMCAYVCPVNVSNKHVFCMPLHILMFHLAEFEQPVHFYGEIHSPSRHIFLIRKPIRA